MRQLIKSKKKKYKQKSWFERIQASEESWKRSRKAIWDALYKKIQLKGPCSNCNEREAIIKCEDCMEVGLCFICDDIMHSSSPFHNREAYIDGYPSPLTPLETVNSNLEAEPVGK